MAPHLHGLLQRAAVPEGEELHQLPRSLWAGAALGRVPLAGVPQRAVELLLRWSLTQCVWRGEQRSAAAAGSGREGGGSAQ